MKKLIVLALLVVGCTTFAQIGRNVGIEKKDALEKISPNERAQKASKRMSKELSLNETQLKQMVVILTEAEANKDFASKAGQEERVLVNSKIEKILSPEQKVKWEKMKLERKEKLKERKEQIKDRRDEKVEKSEAK